MESMVTESMDPTANCKKRIRKYGRKLLKGAAVTLAAANILVIFLYPDLLANVIHKAEGHQTSTSSDQDHTMATLRLREDTLTFDGNGIFDPLESVEAYDENGKDIRDQVAVTYVSGPSIWEKRIVYTLYQSQTDRLEASATLLLENYNGPSITVENVGSVAWEELQKLNEVLEERNLLHAEDGFGNACANQVVYSYEIDPATSSAEITFALRNAFEDYTTQKIGVAVEDFPEKYLEAEKCFATGTSE